MSADYTVHGDVAVIALNNPPVNGLGLSTRLGIMAGLEKAIADDAIKAIVVTGAGERAFVAGGDIGDATWSVGNQDMDGFRRVSLRGRRLRQQSQSQNNGGQQTHGQVLRDPEPKLHESGWSLQWRKRRIR